ESLVKLLPLILIGFFIAFFMVGLLPDYFKILPLGFLTLVGGVILNSLWFLIIGLCSFWLEDAFPFLLVFQKIIFIFGGLFFPIEYLPDWSQPIVRILPFTFSAYWPAKVMIDFSFNKYFFVLSGQIIWIVILFFISVVIFRSAVRRLHVQGG
ncbi:MAG: ABC-2 family transporter protein, partial [Spirochaetales bacterium]|nr:ABC-2 family transporter protein [Spirochaetales bacterium]